MQMRLRTRGSSKSLPLAGSDVPAQVASTTSGRSREAAFTVVTNCTYSYLLTSDDFLHLLHFLPHVGASSPRPPCRLGGASRRTIVDINRGRSRSPNGCVGSNCSTTTDAVTVRHWGRARTRSHPEPARQRRSARRTKGREGLEPEIRVGDGAGAGGGGRGLPSGHPGAAKQRRRVPSE